MHSMNRAATGASLRRARRAAHLRQLDVARWMGVSYVRISALENAARVTAAAEARVLAAIADAVQERGAA